MFDNPTTKDNVIERQIILRDLYKIEVSHYHLYTREDGHTYMAWVYTIDDKGYRKKDIMKGDIIWNSKLESTCEGIDWALVYLEEKCKEEWKS